MTLHRSVLESSLAYLEDSLATQRMLKAWTDDKDADGVLALLELQHKRLSKRLKLEPHFATLGLSPTASLDEARRVFKKLLANLKDERLAEYPSRYRAQARLDRSHIVDAYNAIYETLCDNTQELEPDNEYELDAKVSEVGDEEPNEDNDIGHKSVHDEMDRSLEKDYDDGEYNDEEESSLIQEGNRSAVEILQEVRESAVERLLPIANAIANEIPVPSSLSQFQQLLELHTEETLTLSLAQKVLEESHATTTIYQGETWIATFKHPAPLVDLLVASLWFFPAGLSFDDLRRQFRFLFPKFNFSEVDVRVELGLHSSLIGTLPGQDVFFVRSDYRPDNSYL